MKNIVFIHLESLSNSIFHSLREQFPGLDDILSKSVRFDNFFSTATSSIMAVTDVLYGNNFELDDSISFDEFEALRNNQQHLFKLLSQNGYRTMGIGYPRIWRDDINNFGIWDKSLPAFEWVDTYKEFVEGIDNFVTMDKEQPFALYVWDVRSHLAYIDEIKGQGSNAFERIRLGYSCMDNTLSWLFALLEDKGILNETILVGFGDHGDELWTHSLNNGFCHSNEPYTNLINVPAFIANSDLKASKINSLASLIDLKKTCMYMLNLNQDTPYEHTGINLLEETNEVVYSQNLFANQKPNNALVKAFSVTNRDYHLMVSEYGLEMYAHKFDPTNHCNLLDFFKLNGNEIEFNDRGAEHPHFKNFFTQAQIEHIRINYMSLKKLLYERVVLKSTLIKCSQRFPLNLKSFEMIRPRVYKWEKARRKKWGIF